MSLPRYVPPVAVEPVAQRVRPIRRSLHWAVGVSVVMGALLAARLIAISSNPWWGAANLPYPSWLAITPIVCGVLGGVFLAVRAQIWIYRRMRQVRTRFVFLLGAGAAGGVFSAGLAFLFASLPPWPSVSLANQSAHYCINERQNSWCDHLARKYPSAVARLPDGMRRAFQVSGSMEALQRRLDFERRPEAVRDQVEKRINEAYRLFFDDKISESIAELKEGLKIAPEHEGGLALTEKLRQRLNRDRANASGGVERDVASVAAPSEVATEAPLGRPGRTVTARGKRKAVARR